MPSPKRKPGESKQAFVKRCMADPTLKKENPEPNKRLPVCLAAWEDSLSLLERVTNNLIKPDCFEEFFDPENLNWDEGKNDFTDAAEYQGRKVQLGKPFLTPDGPKKRSVYVKNDKGNVVKVNFGDPNMKIKKSDPARRKSFRARHNCSSPGPRWKARYWSCRAW